MHKLIRMLIVIGLVFFVVVKLNVNDIDKEYICLNDYIYQLNPDKSITLIEYLNGQRDTEIIVPSFIDGYKVACIESECFDLSGVNHLVVCDDIAVIKKNAFVNCTELSYLSIGANIHCSGIFNGLNNLQILQISYGNNGFMCDYSIDDLPDWLDSQESLKRLIIADSIRYIGDYAFYDLNNLKDITWPQSLSNIGKYSFYNVGNLGNVSFDNNLKVVKDYAFYCAESTECNGTINLPQNVEFLGRNCFDKRFNYVVISESNVQEYFDRENIEYSSEEFLIINVPERMHLAESYTLQISKDGTQEQLIFNSSNKKVATVNEHGEITAIGIGKTTITVSSRTASREFRLKVIDEPKVEYKWVNIGDTLVIKDEINLPAEDILIKTDENTYLAINSGNCLLYAQKSNNVLYKVTVFNPVQEIVTNEDVITLKKGNIYDLQVDIYPHDADNKALSYHSSDENIAVVDLYGRITALNNGSCVITIESNDTSSSTKKVTVNVAASKIECATEALPLMVGKTYRLNCQYGNNEKLIYRSDNEKIVKVNKDGVLYGISPGATYITVCDEKMNAFNVLKVKVYDAYSYGIDISEWNGRNYTSDDFIKVKNEGIDFVYIRAAYEDDYKDSLFESNYANCRAAGLDVGAYHYITSSDVSSAKVDAEWLIQILDGKKFEYPIALDIESNIHKTLSANEFSLIVQTYCDTLMQAGYYPIVYSYGSILNKNQTAYDNWIAQWDCERVTALDNDYTIWQFSSKGTINGLNGDVDMDICFVDYPTFIKKNHYNGY
ncbi:MAG: GH25 family lysozyme [Erysipelotrichia bacterium]|nr:GH25 family lysozyme [Erysipelotrichia bacterium]